MNNLNKVDNTSTDITMGSLFSILKQSINKFILMFFRLMNFIRKNIRIIFILIIIGFSIGFYLDYSSKKSYRNEIVITPKFNSVDYLYETVNNYKYNIKNIDKKYSKHIKEVKISAIEDVFAFIGEKEVNLETFKVLAENGDVKKILADENTIRNYKYHKVTIFTDTINNKEIVQSYLKSLNNNKYFLEKQKISKKNTLLKINYYKQSINQINQILDKIGSNENVASSNNLNINTNSQLNEIIQTKATYVENLNWLEADLIEQDKVIFDISSNLNILEDKSVFLLKSFLFPVVLMILFFLYHLLKRGYRKYA